MSLSRLSFKWRELCVSRICGEGSVSFLHLGFSPLGRDLSLFSFFSLFSRFLDFFLWRSFFFFFHLDGALR